MRKLLLGIAAEFLTKQGNFFLRGFPRMYNPHLEGSLSDSLVEKLYFEKLFHSMVLALSVTLPVQIDRLRLDDAVYNP